jgi:hypothetical protein
MVNIHRIESILSMPGYSILDLPTIYPATVRFLSEEKGAEKVI